MDAAVSTLLGVAVGGLVTYAGQRSLDVRREAREVAHEDREEIRRAEARDARTKTAARLVFLDLLRMATALHASRETERWWTALRLPTAAWAEQGKHLSEELGDDAWRKVGPTFAGAAAWNEMVEGAARYYWVRPHLSLKPGAGQTELRDTLLEGVADAIVALMRLGLPTITDSDPMIRLLRAELSKAEGHGSSD